MNILYIGYWSVLDGLSEATIRPHLSALAKFEVVHTVFYVSIEREKSNVNCTWNVPKTIHMPYYSPPKPFFLDKVDDFRKLPRVLSQLCVEKSIDKIICRSSPAGGIGYLIWQQTQIPYFVESYEPHAEYMLSSKVWKKWDVRYWIQRYLENRQKKTASKILTVSESFKKHLIARGNVKIPMDVLPCTVNLDQFKFNSAKRKTVRNKLKIEENALVGIYVGKFGGIYYNRQAFSLFASLFNTVENFFLIILTSDNRETILTKFDKEKRRKVYVNKVAHSEVPDFLSTSDFAFNLHKKTNWSFALSAIKNGEYWANGLPIVISEGIGDDSDVIEKNSGGVVVDYEHGVTEKQLTEILKHVYNPNERAGTNICVKNAINYRDSSMIENQYSKIIQQ